MYSSVTSKVKKTISRFQKTAYCAKFRHDGQLLAAGGEESIVRVSEPLSVCAVRIYYHLIGI